MKTELILSMMMVAILTLSLVKADQVNMDISVNGTANLNITVDADDSELRQDVWGNQTGSGPRDIILDEIEEASNPPVGTEGLDVPQSIQTIDQICDDPNLQKYLKDMGNLPPEDFINYVKSLGYDDEAHITLIWSVCQDKYIEENEDEWSVDTDFDFNSLSYTIHRSMDWLLGKNANPTKHEIEIAQSIDSYCANDKDVYYLIRRVNDLQLRVEALEKTVEELNSTAYCDAKIEVLAEYGLAAVKCGETTYRNHLTSPITGEEMILGITPANGGTQTEQNGNEEEPVQENGYSESVLMSSANGHSTEQSVNDEKVIKMGISPVDLTRDFLTKTVVFLSSFTVTIMLLRLTLPLQQGMLYIVSTKLKSKFLRNEDRKIKKISKIFRTFGFIF